MVLVFLSILQSMYSQEKTTPDKDINYYFSQARTFRNQNNLNSALEALNTAADLADKNQDEKGLIDCFHKFALLYLDLNKQESTYFYWDRANAILKDIAYPIGNAFHTYIEAVLLLTKENNYQALYMLDAANNLTNDRNLRNHILLTQAQAYLNLERYDSASTNFNALVVNTDAYEQSYLSTRGYLGLAELNFENQNWEESAKNALDALRMAQNNGFAKEVLEANLMLGKAYEYLEKFDLSLIHSRNLLKIKDSVFTIEKVKTEAKNADKIQFEHMGETIKKQENDIEKLSESVNSAEITAILTSAFLTIISLLAVSLYRNNQIKLKTNDLLQTKNKELQSARDAAVQAMETKTNFLSTVSHELRTPLYAVTGLTHLLLEENPSENQKEHLKALKFSGDYLLNFINDILQINKIDADKLEAHNTEFHLKKVLADVLNSLNQSAKANNTKLTLEYDEKIPQKLMSDPMKLSQIFINLVGNAIKFTKEGEVKLIAKLIEKEEENVTLYFEVMDNGIGISEDKQKNIFDSFEQGSIQINREYGGTGLGLTIVKSLLGLFDSKIGLKSKLGKGSSFYFELELQSKDSIVDDIPFEISTKEYEFAGLHLMVVEDNKINQVITKKMLAKKEISCDIASNGMDAIELAKNNSYDAILMDIHMPGISGDEATIEIRKFDRLTPIIALTAISLDDSLESFYAAGCDDVVTKPFKPEVFYQKIGENIFDRKVKKSVS